MTDSQASSCIDARTAADSLHRRTRTLDKVGHKGDFIVFDEKLLQCDDVWVIQLAENPNLGRNIGPRAVIRANSGASRGHLHHLDGKLLASLFVGACVRGA
jgi:hypothetical protein